MLILHTLACIEFVGDHLTGLDMLDEFFIFELNFYSQNIIFNSKIMLHNSYMYV